MENGTVVLDEPAALPDGAKVEVTLVVPAGAGTSNPPPWQTAQDMAKAVPSEEWDTVPAVTAPGCR